MAACRQGLLFCFLFFGVGLFFAKIPSLIRVPFPAPQRKLFALLEGFAAEICVHVLG